MERSVAIVILVALLAPAAHAKAPEAPASLDPAQIAEALARSQLEARGGTWEDWRPRASHAAPSDALAAIVAGAGDPSGAFDVAAALALDALDVPTRDALAGVLNAYLDFSAATTAAYAKRPGPDGADATQLAHVFAARALLLERTLELGRALEVTEVNLAPIAVSGVLSVDLRIAENVYTDNYYLQIDGGGSDRYFNNAGGAGTGAGCEFANTRIVGAAIDLGLANDQYGSASGTHCGMNGGGGVGAGFLYDEGGADTYRSGRLAVNGGGVLGNGFLLDASGNDYYNGEGSGANGGSELGGTGLLIDLGGGDLYITGPEAGNGGGLLGGVGMLFDATGNDRYYAGGLGANGGGANGGKGSLVDLAGDDLYVAVGAGANGGGFFGGAGSLYDGGGSDRYVADSRGANGGGELGVGLLFDASGVDSYTDNQGGTGTDRTVPLKGTAGTQLDQNAPTSAASPAFPSGAPTPGPDADDDGIPAYISIAQSSFVADGSGAGLRPAPPLVIPLDNDANANDPARVGTPGAGIDVGCQTQSVCARLSARLGAGGQDLSRDEGIAVDAGAPSWAIESATGHRPYSLVGNDLVLHGVSDIALVTQPILVPAPFQSAAVGAATLDLGCDGSAGAQLPSVVLSGLVVTTLPGQTRAEPSATAGPRCLAMGAAAAGATIPLADVQL